MHVLVVPYSEFFLRNKCLGETDKIVMIRDLSIRTSRIILITICLSIGVINIVSTAFGAETNMSLRHVENATGHRQNATTLSKQSVPSINDTIWGAIVGTIVDSVIHKANLIGSKSGITLADDLNQIANYFNKYSTSVLVFSTVGLLVVTFYYAMQTRALTRNQLRPYLSVSLLGQQQSGKAYQIGLNIENIGLGPAFDILVEYSIKGISKSVRTEMIRAIRPEQDYSIWLVLKGPLLHDRHANRVIQCKLAYEGTSGKYKRKTSLDENEFFKSDDNSDSVQ
jgi:hypothetical protein